MKKLILVLLTFITLNYPAIIQAQEIEADAVFIGGGIMSATLATLLHEFDPTLRIQIYERLPNLAFESSGSLNNAGTGHAALSELNYTPQKADGSIDITKAIQINEEFEISKQFWAYLSAHNKLGSPQEFIHTVPHLSWVHGKENVDFLKKRFAALKKISLFQDMEYTEDPAVLRKWMPVIMEGRSDGEVMAATRSLQGTDLDYGRLTTLLFQNLIEQRAAQAFTSHEVRKLKQNAEGQWQLEIKNLQDGESRRIRSKFVFIGAGGGTLPLLQKSGVKEAIGYGGFPIGGEFLLYKGQALSEQHLGKIYGQAAVGAPPMSIPHLDTRVINGEKRLLFGPFAGATTRFLKEGSLFDLVKSLRLRNIGSMLNAGTSNLDLVKYLIEQETQSHEDRINALREFIPGAKSEEWEVIKAGVRVQIIKHEPNHGNVLRFGTEVVSAANGSLAALLGASPGASISVAAMLEVLQKSFGSKMQSPSWQNKLQQMIPSYGKRLVDDRLLLESVRDYSDTQLHLNTKTCAQLFSRP